MAKKQYFLIVDTETTVKDTVADFGAVIVDRKGSIVSQCAVLVHEHFDAMDLFYTGDSGFWGKQAAAERKKKYFGMLDAGTRMLSSVSAINRWLEKAAGKFSPTLTAYNLPFDVNKCGNTNIDLNMFSERFCLWAAATGNICNTKAYKQFALENHLFGSPTEFGNMTYKTNAEAVAGYLAGNMTDEPHTAIEDAIQYELPILTHILKKKNWKEKMIAYNWRSHQVKDHFVAK